MMATVRYQTTTRLSEDKRHRLDLSREETIDLTLREIHCPYCGFLIDKVFSDATGHKMITCRKCKSEYPINLGYFRRVKGWRRYEGYHGSRQRR